MVFFAAFMMWAYPWSEYVEPGREKTSIWRPLWDSINYGRTDPFACTGIYSEWPVADFAVEIFGSLKYYFDTLRGKSETRTTQSHPGTRTYTGGDIVGPTGKMDFATAFGVYKPRADTDRELVREPDDEAIRLAPYPYKDSSGSGSPDPYSA